MKAAPLEAADQAVLTAARAAADRLYVKGRHECAAAIATADGQIFTAIHLQSANDFATVCGEVACLSVMVAAGRHDPVIVAAVWRNAGGEHFLLPPCGRCRELLSDFNPQTWVLITESDHWLPGAIETVHKVRLSELLPRRWRT